jgi:hypothetical protein
MFGHDESKNNDDHQEPQHDAVLDENAATVQPDDSSAHDDQAATDHGSDSPAFTAELPTASVPAPATPASIDDDSDSQKEDKDDGDVLPANFGGVSDSEMPSDLLNIKQSALKQLTPLVGHLDQTPEEKFRTTMMMIQASDDQGLIKEAYAAAEAITDEKTKAQALLDIVNEINYFTQHS